MAKSVVNYGKMTPEQQELMLKNRGLVRHIVARLGVSGSDYEDALSEGELALCDASMRYDPDSGNKFATYASSYIQGRVMTFLNERRAPLKYSRKALVAKFAIQRMLNTQGIDIEELQMDNEMLKELGIDKKTYFEAADIIRKVSSLDFAVDDDEGNEVALVDLVDSGQFFGDKGIDSELDIVDDFIEWYKRSKERTKAQNRNAEFYREYCYKLICGDDTRQRQMATAYGVSQSYGSRIIGRFNKEFKQYLRR